MDYGLDLISLCPHCRGSLSEVNVASRRKVSELESQVRLLTSKATQAADRLADLEDEFICEDGRAPAHGKSASMGALQPRAATGPLELAKKALDTERQRREVAEQKLLKVEQELAELSQHLFEETNAMVAAERQQKAAMDSEVAFMRERELGRVARLETLESALQGITRAHQLLSTT